MAADQALDLREAVVAKILASADVRAFLDDRFYGEEAPPTPCWPFGKYGLPDAERFEASCWAGGEHDVVLHVFANGPGADLALKIASAVERAIGDDELPLSNELASLDHVRTQVVRDTDEAGAYHAVLTFSATTYAA